MRTFLTVGSTVGSYTLSSTSGDTSTLRALVKDKLREELIVRPAREEDMKGIFELVKSAQLKGADIQARALDRKGLGRSIGEGGLFSDYTGRKQKRMDEFRMLLGTPYLLVAMKGDEMVGFMAGFPGDKINLTRDGKEKGDWKDSVNWFKTPDKTKNYVVGDPLVVARGYRKRGVGEALFRAMLQNCVRNGIDEFHGEIVTEPVSNPAAIGILRRLGFTETGKTTLTLKIEGVDEPMKFGAKVFTIKTR
ncbi:MAG: GNAT family N-acetyltransferase [Candidatus Altiarchaeota archaeon]